MNRNQRRMAAFNARKEAQSNKDTEMTQRDSHLSKRVAMSLSGCSARVYKATMSLPLRSKEQASADNICLPQVAIFAAGNRGKPKNPYHVFK